MSGGVQAWISYEAWIEQGGMIMASAGGDDEAATLREVRHYAAVYGQDGPVTIHGPILVEWIMGPDDDEPTPISPPEYVEKFALPPRRKNVGPTDA